MYSEIELTPDGRLLVRRQKETPEGLREIVSDMTDKAHHCLDKSVILQAGTRLSSIFELLKANESLRDIYTRNRVHAYLDSKLSVRCSPGNRLRNQHIGRDAQALVKSADHGQRQRALATQDFVDAVAASTGSGAVMGTCLAS